MVISRLVGSTRAAALVAAAALALVGCSKGSTGPHGTTTTTTSGIGATGSSGTTASTTGASTSSGSAAGTTTGGASSSTSSGSGSSSASSSSGSSGSSSTSSGSGSGSGSGSSSSSSSSGSSSGSTGTTGDPATTIASLAIAGPNPLALGYGARVQLDVTATYQDGHSAVLAPSAVTWQSSAPAVMDQVGGWLTTLGEGSATLTASAGGASASTAFTVGPRSFESWGLTDAVGYQRTVQKTFQAWGQTDVAGYQATMQKTFQSWGQTNVSATH